MGSEDRFSAGSFKTTILKGEEAAKHRAMFAAVDKHWDVMEDAANAIRFVKSLPKLVAVIAAVFALAAGISALGKIYGVTP